MNSKIANRKPVCESQLHLQSTSKEVENIPEDASEVSASAVFVNDKLQSARTAKKGDIVTIKLDMELDPNYAIEPLFDMKGVVTFVLGHGNYLPDLHELIETMREGESIVDASIDAGWGKVNPDLIAKLKIQDVKAKMDIAQLEVGKSLYLKSGASCIVKEVTEEYLTIDANDPLAGATYTSSVELLKVESTPTAFLNNEKEQISTDSKYKVATFALGCFWGGELEFMRLNGVVGTKVGYTQGHVPNPSYDDVCDGETGHTEAIMVVYDPNIISYEKLLLTATDRLGDDIYRIDQVGYDQGNQYRHGIYYHDDEQKNTALRILKRFGEGVKTELEPAQEFFNAEEYHQQYLLKGGQSAKKNASEYIRCYG